MKNLKRISVLVLALMLCLSAVTFAFDGTDQAKTQIFKGVLSTDTFTAGKPVTLTMYLYNEDGTDLLLTKNANTTITYGLTYPAALGEPVCDVKVANSGYSVDTSEEIDDGVYGYVSTLTLNSANVTLTKETPVLEFTFTPSADCSFDAESFIILEDVIGYYDGKLNFGAANTTTSIEVATPAPSGPKFDASGKATSGTVAGHDIVGGGKTEDRSYFADQFTLTGTTAETTILGIKTKFVPVYAAGADESKAVVKEYTINADEGIAGGAELKFNVVLIGAPADVTGVNISSEIVTK